MIKIGLVVVSGFMAPLLAWMLAPTLLCLAALALIALPVAMFTVVLKRPRATPAVSPAHVLPAPALLRPAAPIFHRASSALPRELAS